MALPYFKEFGWEPLILKVDPDEQEGIKDAQLALTIPKEVRTWQAGCIPKSVTGWMGLRNVGLRSFCHLASMGSRIIKSEQPALAFFSTTMFPVMAIGPYWRGRHSLPYVLDFQDLWINDYYDRKWLPPPGGRGKHSIGQLMARLLEPTLLKYVSRVVTVSAGYQDALLDRYSALRPAQFEVLPFGASECEFASVASLGVSQRIFAARDGYEHWVYVGAAGPYMAFALTAFFKAVAMAAAKDQSLRERVRIHFVGSDYAPGKLSRKMVTPLAVAAGVADMVSEHSERIPYFEALCCLQDADALIVPGSDDPGYNASKIYPYVLARKPLLAIFHEASGVVPFLRKTRAGVVVTFKTNDDVFGIANAISSSWFDQELLPPPLDWAAFEPYTVREMTRTLCGLFDTI